MTEAPGSRTLSRRSALFVGVGFFLLIVVFAFGAFSGHSVSGLGVENGPAILISWLIDTTIDLGVVAVWLIAGYGLGRRLFPLPLREGVGGGVHGDGAASAPASTPQTPHPSPLPQGERGPDVDPLLLFASATALGLGVIGLLTFALGWAGLLTRPSAIGVLLVGVAMLPWRRIHAIKPWLAESACKRFWIGVGSVALIAGVMVPLASLPPGILWKPFDPHPYDVVSYHLQVPREWYEIGRVVPLGHNAFSYFPMGQEMHALLAMHVVGGPWAAMFVSQYQSVAFTLLTVLAVVGLMRQMNAPAWAWPAGQLVAFLPWTTMLGTVAYVESGVTLYSTLTVGWLLMTATNNRFAPGSRGPWPALLSEPSAGQGPRLRQRVFILAGVFAGLAGGMKYTALAMTALPAFALWPIAAGRGFRHSWQPWLAGIAACGLTVSPWLIRNAAWTGNPVFPVGTSLFGPGPFTAEQAERFQIAHQPPPAERAFGKRLKAGWDRVVTDPQFAYGLVPLAAAGIAFGLRTPAGQYAGAVLLFGSAVWLLGTHNMPRFLAPMIPLAVLTLRFWPANRWTSYVLGAIVLVTALWGLRWTASTAAPQIGIGREGLFRVNDLAQLLPPDVKQVRDTNGKLALVGDAQAFFYPFPSGRLTYRNVFNVDVNGRGLADGWLNKSVDELRGDGWWVQISPAELARLSATYRNLPPPTVPYADPAGPPVLLPPMR